MTISDEDTNSKLTDNANRVIQGNRAMHVTLGKPSNLIFGKIWDFGPTEGGGVSRSQIFIQFFQNKLDYGKWQEM